MERSIIKLWGKVIPLLWLAMLFPGFGQERPARADLLEMARRLDLKVLQLYEAGRFGPAVDSAAAALTVYQAVLGADHPDVATVHENLAELYIRQRRYPEALREQQRALKIHIATLGNVHIRTAKAQKKLAFLHARRGNYQAADSLCRQALGNLEEQLGSRHPELIPFAEDLRNLAVLFETRGQLARARGLYQQSFRILENTLGSDHKDFNALIRDLRVLATLYEKQGQYALADTLYRQALDRFRTVLGPDDPEVLRAAENLREVAGAFLAQGNAARAKQLYQTSYRVFGNSLGRDHPTLARFGGYFREVGRAFQQSDELYSAEQLYHQAKRIYNQTLEETHPELASLAHDYRSLGQLYQQRGDYWSLRKAERLYDQALSLLEKSLGEDHPQIAEVARDYRSLGRQYQILGEEGFSFSEQLLRQALQLFEQSLGENDPEVQQTGEELLALGDIFSELGYSGNALNIYETVLPIQKRFLGPDHPKVRALEEKLAELSAQPIRYLPEPLSEAANLEQAWMDEGAGAAAPRASLSEMIAMIRYPTLRVPRTVAPQDTFTVTVSLTEELLTPEVVVEEGETTDRGQLILRLPDQQEWQLDVILSVPGLEIKGGKNVALLTLPREGDSTPATFELIVPAAACAPSHTTIYATLWYEGAFLAKIARPLRISFPSGGEARLSADVPRPNLGAQPDRPGAQAVPESAPPSSGPETAVTQTSAVNLARTYRIPDLTLWIVKDFTDDTAGKYEIQINSPHLQPYSGTFTVPPATSDWLVQQSSCLVRNLQPLSSGQPQNCQRSGNPQQTVLQLQGFGKLLYRNVAPPALRESLEALLDKLGDRFQSIQIYTNHPGIPWELMHPDKPHTGFEQPDFLGARFRMARWHISGNQNLLVRPPQTTVMREVVLISPRYQGRLALPNQQKEVTALQNLRGYRQVPGKFSPLQELFGNYPAGIIHFAGHGEVRRNMNGVMEYVILLEDTPLDLLTWRGLTGQAVRNHPFIFFNACEIGQSHNIANFVDGWAPAVLESGASGYIGGLWPLSDASAAEFAVNFYQTLQQRLETEAVNIADLLRDTRRRFLQNGDPTFLAYVYYGDPNFEMRSP